MTAMLEMGETHGRFSSEEAEGGGRSAPVILAVDDDALVLSAVVRDLEAEFGRSYRVLRAGSGEAGLELLRRLRLQGDGVALLVVDQRMPRMSGIEFLREALGIYPDAKKVLLTAYADTEVAIRAINDVRLDHYLLKPWTPPEEHFYPVLRELLDDWRSGYRPPFEGVRVLAHRWSAEAHVLRDFLTRSSVPHQWLDVETNPEAARLLQAIGIDEPVRPIVVFPDGSVLEGPGKAELARKIGLPSEPAGEVYDLIVVGAGPAGLAAAVYGASEGLATLVIERDAPGGQAGWSSRIENYLGFPTGLSGQDLARRAVAQARRFGAEILSAVDVVRIDPGSGFHTVEISSGETRRARAVLIATGVSYRLLDVPGAERLTGSGIYYGAAATEARTLQGEDVLVLGGGNSAGQAALHLARFAGSVTLLVRNRSLAQTMSRYLVAQLEQTPNVRIRTEVHVLEARGSSRLESLVVMAGGGGEAEEVPAAALYVFIGADPHTEWLDEVLGRDPQGYILSGPDVGTGKDRPPTWTAGREPFWLETTVPGIFVAGDVRHRSVKRVASAVGEGSMAVQFVHQHLGGSLLRAAELPTEIAEPSAGVSDGLGDSAALGSRILTEAMA